MHVNDTILPMVITTGNMNGADRMINTKDRITKELIIECTLKLIDEKLGIRNVSLRDIAKEMGCAHTNIYNYFSSLDEIFWESLGYVLVKMMSYSSENLDKCTAPQYILPTVLSNLIHFSMDHPGWFKLIWLDSIGGTPSSEVVDILHKPSEGFIDLVKMSNNELTQEKATLIAEILLPYLHGELCIWINNRSFTSNREQLKERILLNLSLIYESLTQKYNV